MNPKEFINRCILVHPWTLLTFCQRFWEFRNRGVWFCPLSIPIQKLMSEHSKGSSLSYYTVFCILLLQHYWEGDILHFMCNFFVTSYSLRIALSYIPTVFIFRLCCDVTLVKSPLLSVFPSSLFVIYYQKIIWIVGKRWKLFSPIK